MCDILQPSFDMSIASPSSGTPVPYYRHGNTSSDSHLERTLTKQSINESGNFALILYLFPKYRFMDRNFDGPDKSGNCGGQGERKSRNFFGGQEKNDI